MVATARRTVSLSLPQAIVDELDAWAAGEHASRSEVVAHQVEAESRRRLETALDQAYRELAEDGFYDHIEAYLPTQAEVILADPS